MNRKQKRLMSRMSLSQLNAYIEPVDNKNNFKIIATRGKRQLIQRVIRPGEAQFDKRCESMALKYQDFTEIIDDKIIIEMYKQWDRMFDKIAQKNQQQQYLANKLADRIQYNKLKQLQQEDH